MKYMPGLDGLRAIAVLAVVAYHAGLPVPAGFVGVDIFFVISGYLITRLLHGEVMLKGRIDFMAFYARRARRILPALVVVVLATLMAAGPLLSPVEQQQTARSAAAAFLFAGNVFFAALPGGYFDPNPDTMPLLHLWSLGVEEQFYLVWPVVLLLARKHPVRALATLAVVSFIAAEWLLLSGHSQAAFYQMPARAWELALGGLVALRPVRMPKGSAWVALAVVIGACCIPLSDFPGAGALPAVLGAAALVAAVQSGDRCALLESKPVVGVGLVSYSLYLWHWPVLLFGGLLFVPALLLVAFAGILAVTSYRYVETPARRAERRPRREVFAALTVVMVGFTAAMTLPKPVEALPSIYAMGCDDYTSSATVKPCTFGPATGKTVVVMGDSVGLQWFPALQQVYKDWQIVVLTKSACPMVDASFFYDRIGREYTECSTWRKAALAKVAEMHPDMVILGSSFDYPFDRAQWTDGTTRALRTLADIPNIRILRPTPLRDGPLAKPDAVSGWIAAGVKDFPNVQLVGMNDLLGAPDAYRDEQHLAANFVKTLSAPLAERLAIP